METQFLVSDYPRTLSLFPPFQTGIYKISSFSGESKVCAATCTSDSLPNITAPYVAKETSQSKEAFKTIEIEIVLHHPYCCRTRPNERAESLRRRLSSSVTENNHKNDNDSVFPTPVPNDTLSKQEDASRDKTLLKSQQSFDFVGVIRKRFTANFMVGGSPVLTWSEYITQLAETKSMNSANSTGGIQFQIPSPTRAESTTSLASTTSINLTRSWSQHYPSPRRNLSIPGIVTPSTGDDAIQFFSDARRNSVSMKSPDDRPSSPAACNLGHQLKKREERKAFAALTPNTKTYAAVAAAAKASSSHASNHGHHATNIYLHHHQQHQHSQHHHQSSRHHGAGHHPRHRATPSGVGYYQKGNKHYYAPNRAAALQQNLSTSTPSSTSTATPNTSGQKSAETSARK